MRNYVILNGIKSTTINGLLIQELPQIVKPRIRTQIEEIDGRDGDIVTDLGYSAYDKEMSIGLYGNYDIDDVISYFNSSGTVTFSNEPDKYYNYQIVNEIDFERLIRFKTATVTFHCQPFKYSAVESMVKFDNQVLSIPYYSETKNGISVSVIDGTFSISGTGSKATEFYVPINALELDAGDHVLNASTSGTNAGACSIRLIQSVPSNADSFGGTFLGLKNNQTVSLSGTLTAKMTFNYVWFYITAGTTMNFTLSVGMMANQLKVKNTGNTKSKPIITIYGDGTVNLSLNGNQLFVLNITNGYITVDVSRMEAYIGDILMNRYVTGDYDNLMLNVGENTLSWTGNVSEVDISNYSRWI